MSDTEEKKPYDRSEREFLHDISNPLAIAYGNLRILSAKLEKDPNSLDIATILSKIDKALKNFDKANELLELRRSFIKNIDAA